MTIMESDSHIVNTKAKPSVNRSYSHSRQGEQVTNGVPRRNLQPKNYSGLGAKGAEVRAQTVYADV